MIVQEKKSHLTSGFLAFAALEALGTGIITAYMSSHGCSTAFIAVAIFSFLYFTMNFLLLCTYRAWRRGPTWLILLLVIGVLIVSLIGLAYSIMQSVCELNVCGETYAYHADDFWSWFNSQDRKSNYEDKTCDSSDSTISQGVLSLMGTYSGTSTGNYFHFIRAISISFTAVQSFMSLIQAILTMQNLYYTRTWRGHKPKHAYIVTY